MDMRGIENIEKKLLQEEKDEKHIRLDLWNKKKKELHDTLGINKKDNITPKFDIKPWTIWWFYAGENIGLENGSHVENSKPVIFNRPCIIVSNKSQLQDTNHNKITILPLTTNKMLSKKNNYYKLYASNYQKINASRKGLKSDAYVICNELRTIDTKRLMQQSTNTIQQKDINKIKSLMISYLEI